MTVTPVDISVRLHKCKKSHPDAKWVPPYKSSITNKKGRKTSFKLKGFYRRFESTLTYDKKINPEHYKGLQGLVAHVCPEFLEDVNEYHGGIPNIMSLTDADGNITEYKRPRKGKLIIKRKIEEDGSLICAIVLK